MPSVTEANISVPGKQGKSVYFLVSVSSRHNPTIVDLRHAVNLATGLDKRLLARFVNILAQSVRSPRPPTG
jgi:hypothetical protein